MKSRSAKSWLMLLFGIVLHGSAVVLLIMFINGTGPFEKKPEVAKEKETPVPEHVGRNPKIKPVPWPDTKPVKPDEYPPITKPIGIAITTARRTVIAIDVIFRNVDATDDSDMKARLVEAAEKMLREFVVHTLHAPHIPNIVEVVNGFGGIELVPVFLTTKHIIAPLGKAGQFHGKYLVFRGEALKQAQKTADEKLKRYRVRFASPQACKEAVAKLQEEAKDEESTTIRYLMEVEGILLLAKQGITDDALTALDSLHERFHLNRPEMTVQIFDALLTAYGPGQRKRLMPDLRKAITRLQDHQPPAEREVIRLLEIGLDICFDDLTIPFETRVEFHNDLQRVAFPYGQKLCFDLGNWNDGLRYLVYCKDANLIQLARKDKERPTELKAFMNLGDLWGSWTKSASLSPQRKIACYRRAIYWYERLLEAKLNTPDESIAKNEKSKLLREIEKIENVQAIMGFAISWMSAQ